MRQTPEVLEEQLAIINEQLVIPHLVELLLAVEENVREQFLMGRSMGADMTTYGTSLWRQSRNMLIDLSQQENSVFQIQSTTCCMHFGDARIYLHRVADSERTPHAESFPNNDDTAAVKHFKRTRTNYPLFESINLEVGEPETVLVLGLAAHPREGLRRITLYHPETIEDGRFTQWAAWKVAWSVSNDSQPTPDESTVQPEMPQRPSLSKRKKSEHADT